MMSYGAQRSRESAQYGIQERPFEIWEGEAPAEPPKSRNTCSRSEPRVAKHLCPDGQYWTVPQNKRGVVKRLVPVCHATFRDSDMARLGSAGASPSQSTWLCPHYGTDMLASCNFAR